MKKLLFVFVLLFLINGCGTPNFRSPSVDPYVAKFEKETCIKTDGVNYVLSDVIPDDSGGSSIAYCLRGTKTIIFVKMSYWNNAPDVKKEAMVMHELGHCSLGILNDNDEINEETGEPVSVMHNYIVNFVNVDNWNDLKLIYYKSLINLAKHQNKLINDCIPITEQP